MNHLPGFPCLSLSRYSLVFCNKVWGILSSVITLLSFKVSMIRFWLWETLFTFWFSWDEENKWEISTFHLSTSNSVWIISIRVDALSQESPPFLDPRATSWLLINAKGYQFDKFAQFYLYVIINISISIIINNDLTK